MNNNQMNFDPITGQPINQNTNNIDNNVVHNTLEQDNINNVQQVPITETTQTIQNTQSVANITTQEVSTDLVNNNVLPQQQMQNIPTVDQDKQEFINNTQANSAAKKEEKKDGPNIVFIIILFIIIFAAIFFLFPYLQKTL